MNTAIASSLFLMGLSWYLSIIRILVRELKILDSNKNRPLLKVKEDNLSSTEIL